MADMRGFVGIDVGVFDDNFAAGGIRRLGVAGTSSDSA